MQSISYHSKAYQGQPAKLINSIASDRRGQALQPVLRKVIQARLVPDTIQQHSMADQILLGSEENTLVDRSDFRSQISTDAPTADHEGMRALVYSCVHASQVDVQWRNKVSGIWETTQ